MFFKEILKADRLLKASLALAYHSTGIAIRRELRENYAI